MREMPTEPQRLQQDYLNQFRKQGTCVSVVLLTGENLEGLIKSFDVFAITLECPQPCMIVKTSIATIEPVTKAARRHKREPVELHAPTSLVAKVPIVERKRRRVPVAERT